MQTIRTSVFETNSSSTHSLTINEKKIGTRNIDEFPLPDENGILHISVNTTGDETEFKTFKDYLDLAVSWLIANQTFENSSSKIARLDTVPEEDYERFLKWLNVIYKLMNLPEIECIEITTSLKIEFGNGYRYFNSSYGINWTSEMLDYENFNSFLESTAGVLDKELRTMPEFWNIVSEKEYELDPVLYLSAAAMTMSGVGSIYET